MSKRQIRFPWLSDVLSTTDATVTTSAACTAAIASGACGFCEMTLTARKSTNVGAMIRVVQEFENVAGTLTLAGALTTICALNGNAAFIASLPGTVAGFSVSGTSVVPQVTGVAATNIEWLLDCRYTIH